MRNLLLVVCVLVLLASGLGVFALARNYNVKIHLGKDGLAFEAVKPPGSG